MIRNAVLLALAALLASSALAGEVTAVADKHVEEALAQAAGNRAALEKVLSHYRTQGDPQMLTGARFVIANMTDKGYIVTELRDGKGNPIPFDPLSYTDFNEARAAIEALEKKHGTIDFARDKKILDVETITSAFLIRHIDESFDAWRKTPEKYRVGFDAFLNYVLPYRGSQEPIDDWIQPLRRRYASKARALGTKMELQELYKWLTKDVSKRVRFNPRYYLHPTDQSFTEMGRSGQGRCEDITNMQTFAARSLAIATAADYTPYWARGDNNHAWNVLLDANGKGFHKGNAHAAKIYRKTYKIQRDALALRLPEGREAANRFMASTSYIDVTDQYRDTTDVEVALAWPALQQGEDTAGIGYLCVFNGGTWKAIHWSALTEQGHAKFDRMGRNLLYLPAVHTGTRLVAAGSPLVVTKDGAIRPLGGGDKTDVLVTMVKPKRRNVDTSEMEPTSFLEEGTTYVLKQWAGAYRGVDEWKDLQEFTAGKEPVTLKDLDADGLYWLVPKESRRLERPFTIKKGRQLFW